MYDSYLLCWSASSAASSVVTREEGRLDKEETVVLPGSESSLGVSREWTESISRARSDRLAAVCKPLQYSAVYRVQYLHVPLGVRDEVVAPVAAWVSCPGLHVPHLQIPPGQVVTLVVKCITMLFTELTDQTG